ncbi:DUF4041 domain-containing protein [Methanococcoides sp. NM1]|uniref:DUF4041 domain-containing protein n=1 Tax=Methanococcoides sp. NM1 TaxID=1201013 RepID=UPI00108338B8|nr:DUF4041 domain-containing protein [Methanococcoides sp. NM1]
MVSLTTLVLIGALIVLYIKYSKIASRTKGITDIDAEIARVQKQLNEMQSDYSEKKPVYDKFKKELNELEEDANIVAHGMYKPHFDFDTSEEYKETIVSTRDEQKQMIKDGTAATCKIQWEVEGSKAKGKQMTKKNIQLMLRSFNNECDADTLKVKWNNVDKMETRINRAFEAINRMGKPNQIEISKDYLTLKLEELYLAHEYQEKKYEEKEEQRQIKEQMREEEKARREIEKAERESEQEEVRYQKALEDARLEMEMAKGEEMGALNDKVADLERLLKEAHEKKERAISRAQQTRSGHVYVISNIGSFGEDVYKIGMTRRLEPMDRVRELGDASVPFRFDVHAMIYSDDAPSLENNLHSMFRERQVNAVNNRKEFFSVSLNDIEKAVHELHGQIEFTKVVEAKEYRESLVMREALYEELKEADIVEEEFPNAL